MKKLLVQLSVLATGACLGVLGTLAVFHEREGVHATLPGEDIVLARVGDTTLTRYDYERALDSTLDAYSRTLLDDQGRRRFLENLVATRAIALLAEEELDEAAAHALAKETAAHREEVLVKRYLQEHGDVSPVTPEMIRDYYEKHPERFAGKAERTYEMIASTRELAPDERDRLLGRLATPPSDWDPFVRELQAARLPVVLKRGTDDEAALHTRLKTLLTGLAVGETSQVTFVQERAYLARITGEHKAPARPLAAVQSEIKERLAPQQLKASVRSAAEAALGKTVVTYSTQAL